METFNISENQNLVSFTVFKDGGSFENHLRKLDNLFYINSAIKEEQKITILKKSLKDTPALIYLKICQDTDITSDYSKSKEYLLKRYGDAHDIKPEARTMGKILSFVNSYKTNEEFTLKFLETLSNNKPYIKSPPGVLLALYISKLKISRELRDYTIEKHFKAIMCDANQDGTYNVSNIQDDAVEAIENDAQKLILHVEQFVNKNYKKFLCSKCNKLHSKNKNCNSTYTTAATFNINLYNSNTPLSEHLILDTGSLGLNFINSKYVDETKYTIKHTNLDILNLNSNTKVSKYIEIPMICNDQHILQRFYIV